VNAHHVLCGALALLLVWWGAQLPIELFVCWYSGVEYVDGAPPAWHWAAWGVAGTACWCAAAALLVVPGR
jgi:hypothetical protein